MIKDNANSWTGLKEICLHKHKVCVLEKSLESWLNPFFGKWNKYLKEQRQLLSIGIDHEILQFGKTGVFNDKT